MTKTFRGDYLVVFVWHPTTAFGEYLTMQWSPEKLTNEFLRGVTNVNDVKAK